MLAFMAGFAVGMATLVFIFWYFVGRKFKVWG